MDKIDFLVKVRDGFMMAADAINEYLEDLAPLGVRGWDPAKIKWEETQGPSGPYQRATIEDNKNNRDFELLLEDLEKHKGRLTKDGYFYWLFERSKIPTVGRKKRK